MMYEVFVGFHFYHINNNVFWPFRKVYLTII